MFLFLSISLKYIFLNDTLSLGVKNVSPVMRCHVIRLTSLLIEEANDDT